jgi:hypothetical protein
MAFRFSIFKKIKNPKTPLALHMFANSAPWKKVSSYVFAIEKP